MAKKLIIFILIILVVIGLSYALSKNPNNEENNNVTEEKSVQENQVTVQNSTNNTNAQIDETTDSKEDKDINEEQSKEENKEENSEPVIIGKEEAESTAAQADGKTEDQKAIELVTKEWGEEDKTVNYEIAHKNENNYVISVTNKQTTEVLAWYQVDIKTGEISQQ